MDDTGNEIRNTTPMVRQLVEEKQSQLDAIADQLQQKDGLPVYLPRSRIEKGTTTAAIESLKQNLTYLEGELDVMKEHNYELYPEKLSIWSSLANIWLAKSSVELQEALVEEKLRQSTLKDEITRYVRSKCLFIE